MNSQQPIETWLDLVRHEIGPEQVERLRAMYRDRTPTQGELIFTGDCEFACQHCIYHPAYGKFNPGLSVGEWRRILRDLNEGLGIETFVYGGRSVTSDGLKVLAELRAMLPHARIGLIDNGISLKPFRDEIASLRLDWIDISLDGMEAEHDRQRGRRGSFAEAMESLLWLAEHEVAAKINVLSCLTTINQHAIIPLVQFLNREGFTNVFITPVSVSEGYRPDGSLQVLGAGFATFVETLQQALGTLDDAWLEINMFGIEYMRALAMEAPELWQNFKPEDDHLTQKLTNGNNELFVNYFPDSLTGIREFIVNTDGGVIVPKSMAKGKVPESECPGNLLNQSAREIVTRLPYSHQFAFYEAALQHEARAIKEMKWQLPIPVR